MTDLDDLPATVLKACAEACGIGCREAVAGRSDEGKEALQLTVWVLSELEQWSVERLGACICRKGDATGAIQLAAYSRCRRDPSWRAKAHRLLERFVDGEEEGPQQLDLLAEVDTSSQAEPCNAWGFEEQRGKRYFAELNERAMRAFKAGLEQEAKEREQAA